MSSTVMRDPISKTTLWAGRVMSALPVLLILFGSVMKLMKTAAVIEGFVKAGAPERLIVPVGMIELVCVVVYLIPRTAVLGAILMTGLLGGATLRRFASATRRIPCQSSSECWHGVVYIFAIGACER